MVLVYFIVLSSCSILLSYFLHGARKKINWIKDTHKLWWILPLTITLTSSDLLTIILGIGLYYSFCSRINSVSNIAAMYIGVLGALNNGYSAHIPFPGINYLIDIDWPLACCFVLIPHLLKLVPKIERTINSVDIIVCLFVIITSMLNLRSSTFTDGLRHGFIGAVNIIVPYFLLSRGVNNIEEVYKLLSGIYTMGIIFACIGFFSVAKQWNIYQGNGFSEIRYGLVRINGVTAPFFHGYVCSLASILLLGNFFNTSLKKGINIFVGSLFALSIYMCLTRGVWIAEGLLLFFYWLLNRRTSKIAVYTILLGFMMILIYKFVLGGNSDEVDEFGTFEYRKKLWNAAPQQFYAAPIIGDVNYLESGPISQLPRGMGGIIDIVSTYLQIVLQYGLVGITLYIIPFVLSISKLFKYREKLSHDAMFCKAYAFLISAIFSYLFMIGTTSSVSIMDPFGWILLALSQALILVSIKEIKNKKSINISKTHPKPI